jgi:ABC-type Mn2+/Zn2+ transport system ATPase subunit
MPQRGRRELSGGQLQRVVIAAVVADKDSGIFLDPSKIHALDHRGERQAGTGLYPADT